MFAHQGGLATFADDSVSYLVMAQVFSPFQPASQAVASAFAREATYPPLFPLVLALAGAAHDVAWAHVLTALILAGCVPLVYALGVRWFGNRGAAAAAALSVVLLPSVWINAKGILSESLFSVLLLATLWVLDSKPGSRGGKLMLALLLSALALTRTVALPMIAVYALWAATRPQQTPASRAQALIPALVAATAYAAWVLLRPADTADSYARILSEHAQAYLGAGNPLAAAGASLARQLNAVAEGWVGSLLIFWVEGRPARTALAGAIGVLALAGMVLRLLAGKADAWMMAGYLLIFLAWPFYDQMGRFLFPVLPVHGGENRLEDPLHVLDVLPDCDLRPRPGLYVRRGRQMVSMGVRLPVPSRLLSAAALSRLWRVHRQPTELKLAGAIDDGGQRIYNRRIT